MGIGISRACQHPVKLLWEPNRGITERSYSRVGCFAIVLTKKNRC
jgi:hypothetical protein